MQKARFTCNDIDVKFTTITTLDEIDTVIQAMGADFVINTLRHAIRDRAFSNYRAGVEPDEIGRELEEK